MIMSYHLYMLIYPEKNLNPIKESVTTYTPTKC